MTTTTGIALTTTPTFEGRDITRYFGIVTGEAILGANAWSASTSTTKPSADRC